MSSSSLSQLGESYAKIIEETLKHVRESGLLRDVSREVYDELDSRWRTGVGQELASMEARLRQTPGARPLNLTALVAPGAGGKTGSSLMPDQQYCGNPSNMPEALRKRTPDHFAHMTGVTFAEPFQLPAPLQGAARPAALQCSEGFSASHTETPDSQATRGRPLVSAGSAVGPAAATAAAREAEPAWKKARCGAQPGQAAETGPVPLAPPLDVLAPARQVEAGGSGVQPQPPGPPPLATPPAPGEASDDEYDGCFEGAEVIVSAATEPTPEPSASVAQSSAGEAAQGAVVPAMGRATGVEATNPACSYGGLDRGGSSSEGSELGSDLDDSEFDEPTTENLIYAELKKVERKPRQWSLELGPGVLFADGMEYLFQSGKGNFERDDEEGPGDAQGALEDIVATRPS
mmetsp:Transcript_102353/g.285173  ORF Transcript_102353/g.285173 Transcript_102353/m.285173 type:complete len:404 (-) Transcript_102353:16-1227(-)